MIVVDFAYVPASPDELKAAGAVGVVRYLAPLPNGKAITKAEYDAYVAAGLGVALNWEQSETTWRGGYNLGYEHGVEARRQANALGHPSSRPIYVSYDYNLAGSDFDVACEYQNGFNKGAGGAPQGAYGVRPLLERMFDDGLIVVAWQTNARGWNGNNVTSPRAALQQHYRAPFGHLDPASVDVNDVLAADWGQHDYQPAPHPKPTKRGRKMFVLFTIPDEPSGDTKTVWVTDGLTRRSLASPAERDAWIFLAASAGIPNATVGHLDNAVASRIPVAN